MAVEEKVRVETGMTQSAVGRAGTDDDETLRQAIALRAYQRYCERGCAPGCDVDDWLAAEREILAARVKPTAHGAPASADDRRGRRRSQSRR